MEEQKITEEFQETPENTTHDYKLPNSDEKINTCPDVVDPEIELRKLSEIGKEIEVLENKLQEIPGTEQLDMSKFNRKQRRQMQRRMIHDEKEKQGKLEQKGNTFVTRKEFVGLFQSAQKLRDRLYYVDILTAALEKLLIEKTILTEQEIADKIKSEAEKAQAFQEIEKGEKDYENRLKKCLELQIDPNISRIGQQIFGDSELEPAEKLRLAKEYNIKLLVKILEEQSKQQSVE